MTMDRFTHARRLVEMGFYLFPCLKNDKRPAVSGWQEKATQDMSLIEDWFLHSDFNIGISTSKFGDGKAVVVVDVDDKGDKRGSDELFKLELQGYEFPCTFEQATPSGGKHLIYISDKPCKQGVSVLGPGLDIRSQGGYIVGPGSEIDGRKYAQINGHGTLSAAPDWLVHKLGQAVRVERHAGVQLDGVDSGRAVARAIEWLKTAPAAIEGQGGDHTTFRVACQLKDFGVDEDTALTVLADHWNERCQPPWDEAELEDKIKNAYRYGREPVGAIAPEAVFEAAAAPEVAEEGAHPFDVMNKEFAYIKKGAFILQETTDHKGTWTNVHLSQDELHGWYANKTMQIGDKRAPISKLWIQSERRREYEAVVFAPEQDRGPRWYNLWQGFTVAPAATGDHPAVTAFKEHALTNVCGGDEKLCHWLLGFFAHIVQRPWEKPLVALVFKGRKGTGKNALVERVGALFKPHFFVADDDRYLLSNFNSHLESCLFLVLDEAAWAGDKRAEGRLKGLITGADHNIERKGKEPYKVDNLTRTAIIGNEDWLVPASADERRFAVFNVGDGRRQDRQFFHDMRVGMEKGGYAHLLRFLLDYDISGLDVNEAPKTVGLTDQKLASLDGESQWWFSCLYEGRILEGDFGGEWPERVPSNRMYQAFERYARKRNIRSRLPSETQFVSKLKKFAPAMTYKKARPDNPGDTTYAFFNPGLKKLRKDWEQHLNSTVDWNEE